jgi:hypothetical protein
MPGYTKKAMYQTEPTEEIETAEERFVVEKPGHLELAYKVLVFAMLAYIVARMNKIV